MQKKNDSFQETEFNFSSKYSLIVFENTLYMKTRSRHYLAGTIMDAGLFS